MNSWAAIAFALTGMENAGMMAAEIRDPLRTLPRAAAISSAFVVIFYIAATLSLLVMMAPANISEMNGLAQVSAAAGTELGVPWLGSLVVLFIVINVIGAFGGLRNRRLAHALRRRSRPPAPRRLRKSPPQMAHPARSDPVARRSRNRPASRLPGRRHSKNRLPHHRRPDGHRRIPPYLYVFASAWKAKKWISALAGTAVTFLAIACSIVPPPEVKKVMLFEGKLALGTFAAIASGWLLYRRNK